MNKDVIYIEPEDDITDIITKIENSKEKIVALVPPKKAGVFRSVVNIKLIAKSSAAAEKTVVLVTTDPSIVKLAAATKLPVTKNLQTAPVIPTSENLGDEISKEELVEDSDGSIDAKKDAEESKDTKSESDEDESEEDAKLAKAIDEKSDDDEDDDDNDDDKKHKKSKREKPKKSSNGIMLWFADHKRLAISGGVGILALILVLVWAMVIAPAATVTVGIRTTTNNFSENVTFVSSLSEENAEEGKFYLEEKKVENVKEVEFEATGSKNVGEKAKGEITVIATISSEGGTKQVRAGDTFTNDGLKFVADSSVTMVYDGKDDSVCENADSVTKREFNVQGCKIYSKVKVTAAEPGSQYNISPRESGWDTTAPVAAYTTSSMDGGTDNTITVVQQSDIEKAKNEVTAVDENVNKEKLYEQIGDDMIVISSSFKQTAGETTSTPAVGEEVKPDTKPVLKATATATIYVIDKTKVEEYITEKAKLGDDQKIYEIKDPFIENFMKADGGYAGKLKTTYMTGPKLTVASIVDMIKGKGFGDAQHILKDVSGVTEVTTEGSFPWVRSIPNDSNKITVNLEIKDQNGNKVEQKVEEKQSDKQEENKDDNKEGGTEEGADKDSEKSES